MVHSSHQCVPCVLKSWDITLLHPLSSVCKQNGNVIFWRTNRKYIIYRKEDIKGKRKGCRQRRISVEEGGKISSGMVNSSINVIVSSILKNENSSENELRKKSKEEWRKAKELEEARKVGTAPAAVDEEGKDINPHIPQYISSTPWYFGTQTLTLRHQRSQPEKQNTVP